MRAFLIILLRNQYLEVLTPVVHICLVSFFYASCYIIYLFISVT